MRETIASPAEITPSAATAEDSAVKQTVPSGLALWHGLGPRFGLGESAEKIDRGAAVAVFLALLLLLLLYAST